VKFGIYRSLDSKSMLRDEQVRFADFCVSKVSASECDDGLLPPVDGGGLFDAGGIPDASRPVDAGFDPTGSGGAGGQGGGMGSGGGGAGGTSTVTTGGGSTATGGGNGVTGGTGGSSGAGGSNDHGGVPMPDGGSGGSRTERGGQDLTGGCSCRVGSRDKRSAEAALVGALGCALMRVRRRRRTGADRA
jgi:hypothetical protein